ncbi:hypothetical protein GW17_00046004 [Ensete ventricosum]|nr:hypothetical protein GW17_00046004 [Ensete ventricosum]
MVVNGRTLFEGTQRQINPTKDPFAETSPRRSFPSPFLSSPLSASFRLPAAAASGVPSRISMARSRDRGAAASFFLFLLFLAVGAAGTPESSLQALSVSGGRPNLVLPLVLYRANSTRRSAVARRFLGRQLTASARMRLYDDLLTNGCVRLLFFSLRMIRSYWELYFGEQHNGKKGYGFKDTRESHGGDLIIQRYIGATRQLDCFSAYIRLREPDKSEDKADSPSSLLPLAAIAIAVAATPLVRRDFCGVIDPLLSWKESVGRERGRGAASGLQVQTRSQTAGATHEERGSEHDEREVGYSLRAEEA